MKTHYVVALSAAAGIAVGAVAVRTLHAQAKPPGYIIAEIDVSDPDGYAKDFLPKAGKALTDGGAKFIVRGGKPIAIDGAPPPSRIVITRFDSQEQGKAAYTSPAYMDARKIGDKYAKFRIYAVEGIGK